MESEKDKPASVTSPQAPDQALSPPVAACGQSEAEGERSLTLDGLLGDWDRASAPKTFNVTPKSFENVMAGMAAASPTEQAPAEPVAQSETRAATPAAPAPQANLSLDSLLAEPKATGNGGDAPVNLSLDSLLSGAEPAAEVAQPLSEGAIAAGGLDSLLSGLELDNLVVERAGTPTDAMPVQVEAPLEASLDLLPIENDTGMTIEKLLWGDGDPEKTLDESLEAKTETVEAGEADTAASADGATAVGDSAGSLNALLSFDEEPINTEAAAAAAAFEESKFAPSLYVEPKEPEPKARKLADPGPSREVVIQNVREAIKAKELDKAVMVLKRRLVHNSEDWESRLFLGHVMFLQGRYLDAERTLVFVLDNCSEAMYQEVARKELNKFRRETTAILTATAAAAAAVKQARVDNTLPGAPTMIESIKVVQPPKPVVSIPWKLIGAGFGTLLALYAGGWFYLYSQFYGQLLLHPNRSTDIPANMLTIGTFKGEIQSFPGANGNVLTGIYYKHPEASKIVIVHHNQDTNMCDRRELIKTILAAGLSVFIFDYQGYGRSAGSAKLDILPDEGFFAYDYVYGILHYRWQDIVIYGESLGCEPACKIVRYRKSAGLILADAFPSLPELVRKRFPIFLLYPAQFFPDPKMDLVDHLNREHPPALFLVGLESKLVKRADTLELYPRVCEPRRSVEISAVGDTPWDDASMTKVEEAIRDFKVEI